MRRIRDVITEKPWLAWVLFFATFIVVFLVGLFGASIIERRSETQYLFKATKPINPMEPRNQVWGEAFPREWETYQRTLDTTFATKYGGNISIDMLERYPNLVILWAGYAFAKGYNQGRGHMHAIEDVRNSLRTGSPQPATCWTCKSPDVPRVMKKMGVAEFYKQTWTSLGQEITNPIGCADCHDAQTLNLTITRPALVEAFQRQGKDIKKASHQEMRSLVCAQCHVEYYFKGKEEHYLTFPWDQGIVVDSIEKYYDRVNHVDFVHYLSRTPILKAQHPDWEISQMGIHAQRGVTCVDCHMPYMTEGGVKYTNHQIVSPVKYITEACQVCHRQDKETLLKNIYDRQDKIRELLSTAEEVLVHAHIEAKTAWDHGATEEQMKEVMTLIRHAQWRWDFVAASHGASFHAPIECARILATSIQRAEAARGRLAAILTSLGEKLPVQLPDLTTKAKAQAYLGFDMRQFSKEKASFIQSEIPKWDKQAQEREAQFKNR
ncbi:MAG: ammonia-forming cytochrome c nitrite reductase [Bacteroidota bacterium]|nr:ammonia-forming cytochrome c nitrite reductase [Bacteroidota bacterium]